jgi:hypothetical protein
MWTQNTSYVICKLQICEGNQISDNEKDEPVNNLRWKTGREKLRGRQIKKIH